MHTHTHTHLNRGERLHVASLLQEDALGDLQQLSQAGRTTDPRKELSLLKASLGGLQVGWPAIMTKELFDHPKILCKVTEPLWTWWETSEKCEIAAGWSRLHRVDAFG